MAGKQITGCFYGHKDGFEFMLSVPVPVLDTFIIGVMMYYMDHQKKISILFFLLLVVGLVSSCYSDTQENNIQNISAAEAFELVQNKPILVLDVRTPGEFASGYIKDAVLIPVQVLNSDYTKILNHKENPVLVYCRSGNRSVTASKILADKGFKNLYNMEGGIKAWVQKGFPIEKKP